MEIKKIPNQVIHQELLKGRECKARVSGYRQGKGSPPAPRVVYRGRDLEVISPLRVTEHKCEAPSTPGRNQFSESGKRRSKQWPVG
jgi:hypothetical protein